MALAGSAALSQYLHAQCACSVRHKRFAMQQTFAKYDFAILFPEAIRPMLPRLLRKDATQQSIDGFRSNTSGHYMLFQVPKEVSLMIERKLDCVF